MTTFSSLGINSELCKAIEELGYVNPMPVQEAVIPILLSSENKHDLVALAQTGTGKTAAFGLPLLQRINESGIHSPYPQALVLCPTRELCLQIAEDLTHYAKYLEPAIRLTAVYGGAPIEKQMRQLKQGTDIIVATPGRLIDLMERRYANISQVSTLVMDEADEMLNMGFTESIEQIVCQLPEDRKTLMFSATMSKEISRVARKYLREKEEITIGERNKSTDNVKHIAYTVHAKDKYEALKRIADYHPNIYAIIFCRTRLETQEIADKLVKDGYSADALHGELSQQQRDLVMKKFRSKHLQMLVATDVAARGLDVDNLTHVINYALPDDTESYTHRSGRTGRAGKKGTSIAIINLREKFKLRQIEQIIKQKFEHKQLPTGEQICTKQLLRTIDQLDKTPVNEEDIEMFMPQAEEKLAHLSKEDIIKRFVSMQWGQYLQYYKNRKDLDQPIAENKKAEKGSKDKGDRGDRKRRTSRGFQRIFINLGKADNFFPYDLIGLINSSTRGARIELGKIDIMRNFSFFEVEESQTRILLKSLNKTRWDSRKVIVEVADDPKEENRKPKKKYKH